MIDNGGILIKQGLFSAVHAGWLVNQLRSQVEVGRDVSVLSEGLTFIFGFDAATEWN